jgi:hypothetical protein
LREFWDLIWLIFTAFMFVAYLLVLFQIIGDVFRDSEMSGVARALWIIGLIALPGLTALVYVFTRGAGMAARQRAMQQRMKSDTDDYIRQVAGKSPAEQIADAKRLHDAGTINAEEFAKLKAKALG